jgi:N-acetylmuramoyl-L-alanine amidase
LFQTIGLADNYNTARNLHRIRTRNSATVAVERELFQTLLGFAFTVQQEHQKNKAPQSVQPLPESLASGLHPALQRIAACAQNITEAAGAAIALGSPESMVCVARSGVSAPPVGARFDAGSGLSGECIRNGEPAICVNAAADPRVNYQACRALDIASMLYFPLRSVQGKLIGMLGVFSPQPLHFSQRDLTCLRFTEGLVREAMNRAAGDPDPATIAVLLRHAGFEEPTAEPVIQPVSKLELRKSDITTSTRPAQLVPIPPASTIAPPIALRPEVRRPEPKPEAIFVGRVIDDSVSDAEIEESLEPEPFQQIEERNRTPLILAGVVALFAILAFFGYGKVFHSEPKQQSAAMKPAETAEAPAPQSEQPATLPSAELPLSSQVSLHSEDTTATVTIALPHAIRFEGYQLSNPDRIYFDLHDIKLTDAKGSVLKSDEGLISRVRLAEYGAGVTRVVFDLRQPASFEAKLAENPERLIIELHRTSASSRSPLSPSIIPTKVTIVVDPGHGGHDLGTVSNGLQEKDLTLDVAQRLGFLLRERLGATVIFTREDDQFIPLDRRAEIANTAQADFMISIHANSSSLSTVRGVETYYFQAPEQALQIAQASLTIPRDNNSQLARRFAADVHTALLRGLNDRSEQMRDRGVKSASFVVLREAQMPAVLAEISFLTNTKDAPKLESGDYRERIARALYRGIANHVRRLESRPTALAAGIHKPLATP